MISTQLKITGEVIINEQFFEIVGHQIHAWFDSCYLEMYESFSQLINQDIISNLCSLEWIDQNPSHVDLNVLYHSNNQESAKKFQSSDLLKQHIEVLQNNGLTVEISTVENFDIDQSWYLNFEILSDNIHWIPTDMQGNQSKKNLWGIQFPMFDEDNNLVYYLHQPDFLSSDHQEYMTKVKKHRSD